MRLDRLLANLKFGSRKEVQQMIKDGQVFINGEPHFTHSTKLNPKEDKVVVSGEEIYYKEEIILALYKPVGYLSANHDSYHPVALDLLELPYSRHPFKIAGRLDLDSEGLLILTTNGNTVHLITNPNQKVLKTYEVTTKEEIDEMLLNRLLEPISILDGSNKPYLAKALDVKIGDNKKQSFITIDTGKFHQVRRMYQAIGYEVVNLKRIKVGKLNLPNIKPGEYIEVTKEDILWIKT